jgi:hypothetical protein
MARTDSPGGATAPSGEWDVVVSVGSHPTSGIVSANALIQADKDVIVMGASRTENDAQVAQRGARLLSRPLKSSDWTARRAKNRGKDSPINLP